MISKRSKGLILLLLLMVPFFSVIPFVPVQAAGENWLTGWTYRRSHEINGSSVGALNNYLMGIKVNYGSDIFFEDNGMDEPFYDGSNPNAAYYNGTTYITWEAEAGYNPWIICYNHTTNLWSDAVKIANSPLSSDDHGAPSIVVDDSGYIHVFYGSHVSDQKYAISDNPEDITSWTVQVNPWAMSTYPRPVKLSNGSIYVFYRKSTGGAGKHEETYIRTDDGGASWGAENKIIEVDANTHAIYSKIPRVDSNDNINLIWRYHDGTNSEDIYYAYLNTTDGNMYNITGTNLGPLITRAESQASCMVYDSGAIITCFFGLRLNATDFPYILYSQQNSPDFNDGVEYFFTMWNGTGWRPIENITTSDHVNNGMELIVNSPTNVTAYFIGNGTFGQGGDIDEWSWNGTFWNKTRTILSEATAGKPLIQPEIVTNYDPKLMLVFSQFGGKDVGDLRLYAWNGTSFVPPSVAEGGAEVRVYGHSKPDFGDIRFTASDGDTELEYWMETKVDSDYAIFWVNVTNIPADPNQVTIYMYYGNATANTTSTELREDFTTYTEVEEIDDIQKTSYHVDFLDSRDRTTYLYKDYGANHFGNFTFNLDVKRVTHGADSNLPHILLADVVKGEKVMRDDLDAHFMVFSAVGAVLKMNTWEFDAGGVFHKATPGDLAISAGTMYYMAFRKYGVYLLVDVYSTQALRAIGASGDVISQNITLQADYEFRYNYIGNTYDSSTAPAGSSDMESLLIREYVDPEPIHDDWGNEEVLGGANAPTADSVTITNMDDSDNLYSQLRDYNFNFTVTDLDGVAELDFITFALEIGAGWVNGTIDCQSNALNMDVQGNTTTSAVTNSTSGTSASFILPVKTDWDINEASDNDIHFQVNDTTGAGPAMAEKQTDYFDTVNDLVTNAIECTDANNPDRVDISNSIQIDFTAYYENDPSSDVASTFYPPDAEFTSVSIYNEWDGTLGTDNSIVNGAGSATGTANASIQSTNYNLYINMADADYVDGEETTTEAVITDRVNITLSVPDTRVNVSGSANIGESAVYAYGGAHAGTITLNDTEIQAAVGNYTFTVSSVTDTNYGLTAFLSNAVWCVFDQQQLQTLGVNNSTPIANETVEMWLTSQSSYDAHALTNGDSIELEDSDGAVYVFTWNGSMFTNSTSWPVNGTITLNTWNMVNETTYIITTLDMNSLSLVITVGTSPPPSGNTFDLRVVNSEGTGIQSANVRLYNVSGDVFSEYTNSTGYITQQSFESGNYTLTILRGGYALYNHTYSFSSDIDWVVTLTVEETATASIGILPMFLGFMGLVVIMAARRRR